MINIQVFSHMQVEKGTKEFQTRVLIAMLRDLPVESRYVLKKASFLKSPQCAFLSCVQPGTFPQE